jgi:hypothetical protein
MSALLTVEKRDAGQAYAGRDNVVNATRLVVADTHDGSTSAPGSPTADGITPRPWRRTSARISPGHGH